MSTCYISRLVVDQELSDGANCQTLLFLIVVKNWRGSEIPSDLVLGSLLLLLFLSRQLMGWKCSKTMIMRSITLITIIIAFLPLSFRRLTHPNDPPSRHARIGHNLVHHSEIFISQLCLIASTISIFMELGYDFLFNKMEAPKAYSLERLLIVSGYLLQYRT